MSSTALDAAVEILCFAQDDKLKTDLASVATNQSQPRNKNENLAYFKP